MSDFSSLSFDEKIKNIFTFDTVRIQKLLEICQHMISALAVGFFLGYLIDHMFPPFVEDENKATSKLIIEVVGQSVVLAITTYYVKKIMRLIPFLFKFTKNYTPSLKGEGMYGINIGLGLLYVTNQTNYRAKLTELRIRILGA